MLSYIIAIGFGSGLILQAILTSVLILLILMFPASIQGLFKLSPIGTFFLKIEPMSNFFNMMNSMIMDKVSFLAQMQYIIPIILFTIISVVFMVATSKKLL